MRKTLAKGFLAVGVGAMTMLSQGCKRTAPAPTPAAAPRSAPAPRFEPFPNDGAVEDTGALPQPVRHRRRELPSTVQTADVQQETAAQVEAEQRKRDAALLQQQEAASQKQQLELNRIVQQSQKAQEEDQGDPRIQDAPGPEPGSRIQDAPGPSPGPRIQDAPGPAPGSRIQDAPGPSQPMPPQPQTPPQV
jgi:hypothetical protein